LKTLATELVTAQVASAVVVAAAVWREGRWINEVGAFGRLARGPHERTTTAATWFDLASLTKPITALTAARLVRAKRLTWETRLGSALPELADTSLADATIELLLAHRAGLEAHRPLFRHLVSGKLSSRGSALVEAASARRGDAAGPLSNQGFAPVYSDLGYLLVGEVLARVSSSPLDEVLEREVLAPIGAEIGSARIVRARRAAFGREVAATEIAAWRGGPVRGFVHDENAWALSGEGASGHAGLFGTAAGVLTVGRAVIDALHGRAEGFLKKDEIWPLVKPRPAGTLRAGFDGKSERGSLAGVKFGPSTVGHLGFTGTSVWCDVDQAIVGVVLTNRVHPTRDNQLHRRAWPRAYDRIAEWAEGVRR
jgi:CubicO group peptidase (beta-lactamase class C family)